MSMKNVILLILLLSLGSFYYYDTLRERSATEEFKKKISLFTIAYDDLSKINIEFLNDNFRLERKDGEGWQITDPIVTPADSSAVEKVFTELLDMKIIRIIKTVRDKKGEMDEKWEQTMDMFGLNLPDIIIDLESKDKKESIYFGKPAPTLKLIYARKDNTVLLLRRSIRETILKNHNLFYWREKRLINLKNEDILAFNIYRQEGDYHIKRGFTKEDWILTSPIRTKADPDVVNGLIDVIMNLKAQTIYDERPDKLDKEELPVVKLELVTKTSRNEIKFFLPEKKGGFAATNGLYYKIKPEIIFGFNLSLLDIRNKRVVKYKRTAIDRIDIFYNEEYYSINKTQTGGKGKIEKWAVEGVEITGQNLPYVRVFLNRLKNLSSVKFPEKEDVQLEPVTARIVLKSMGVSVASLQIGVKNEELYYARNRNGELFMIPDKFVDNIPTKKQLLGMRTGGN